MKKTVSVAIGGRNFILDESAYNALGTYLDTFRTGIRNSGDSSSCPEVMEELEMRIADLFWEKLKGREVVDLTIVESVTAQLGMPDWTAAREDNGGRRTREDRKNHVRRYFRDTDSRLIGGVCSGLSIYLNVDVVLIRIIFVVALLLGSAGFWIYVIIWLIAPAARTAVQKCELRGIPATAENIRNFSKTR